MKLFTTETFNLNPGRQNIVAVAKRTSWREDDDGDDDDDGSDDDNLNINFIIIMMYDNKIELLRKEPNA